MNKILLLTSASVFAIGIGAQAGAVPAVHTTLEDLCGETVSVDTMVVGTVEDITTTDSTCEILLTDDAKLSIKNADITLADELLISGDGSLHIVNAWVDLKAVDLEITSGDIIIRYSHIDAEEDSISERGTIFEISTGSGNIDLRNNDFSTLNTSGVQASMEIFSITGDIAAVANYFDVGGNLNVSSTGGNVEFKVNTGSVNNILSIDGVEVTVKSNDVNVVFSNVDVQADAALQVKNNDFSPNNDAEATSSNGPCVVQNNIPVFDLGGAC